MALLDRPPEDKPYRERMTSTYTRELSAKSVQRPVQQKGPEEPQVPRPPPHPPKHPLKPPSSRYKQHHLASIHTNDSIKDATTSSHDDAGVSPADGEDVGAAEVASQQRGSHHVDLDLMTQAREKSLPPKPKRVQSANPRLRGRPPGGGVEEPASHGDKPQVRRRPVSAKAAVITTDDSTVALQNTQPHPPPDVPSVPDMEPWVFGYRSGSYVSSTEPGQELPDAIPNRCFDHSRVDKEHRSVVNTGRWAMPRGAREGTSDTRVGGMTVSSHTDLKLEELSASVPSTLRPILPWLTSGIPKEWIGVDPSQCLVFLPSLLRMPDPGSLPCVPAPMAPSDPLPHHGRVVPSDEKPPALVRKYAHPWTKVPVEEWVCRHGGSRGKHSQIQIYSQDGKLLHQSRTGRRTADTVRREITELEDLMKGIGTADGTSIIVRYQADINKLQEMLGQIMGRVEEIERREAEKNKVPEPSDYSGVRAFLEHHEEVIKVIEARHRECVQELALLENDIETDTECSLEDAPQDLMC